jgi:membrane protein YdbS with pleckstrin-like domain
MQKQHRRNIAIISGSILLILAAALLLYFQDIPALWSLSILAVVAAVAIIGYLMGFLLTKRKK